MEFFPEPGAKFEARSFVVIQPLEAGYAIAVKEGQACFEDSSVVLLYDRDLFSYADRQQVVAADDEAFVQIGVYDYYSRLNQRFSVPILSLVKN